MSQDSETNNNSTASSYTPTFIFTYESSYISYSHRFLFILLNFTFSLSYDRSALCFPFPIFFFVGLIKIVSHIEFSSDVLRTARAVRLTNRLRKNLTEDTLIQYLLNLVLSKNSELNARLSSFLIIEVNFQDSVTEYMIIFLMI